MTSETRPKMYDNVDFTLFTGKLMFTEEQVTEANGHRIKRTNAMRSSYLCI